MTKVRNQSAEIPERPSNKEMRNATKVLIDNPNDDNIQHEKAVEIVQRWRLCHWNVLGKCMSLLVEEMSKAQLDEEPIVVARLKRMPSIIHKLQRSNKNSTSFYPMSTMGDIGGCRIIATHNNEVPGIVTKVKSLLPQEGFEIKEIKDYRNNPKPSGYRGVHIMTRFDRRNIEIQIRGMGQHQWATALENADTLWGVNIKSGNPEEFDQNGQRLAKLFRLLSPSYCGESGPDPRLLTHDRLEEIQNLDETLQFYAKLSALQGDTRIDGFDNKNANDPRLIVFVPEEQLVYDQQQLEDYKDAQVYESYTKIEEDRSIDADVVLAFGVDNKNVQTAFPNYFLDNTAFLKNFPVRQTCQGDDQSVQM